MSRENLEESVPSGVDPPGADRAEICRELAEIGAKLDAVSEFQISGRHRVIAILDLHRRRAALVWRLATSSSQA